VGALSACRQGWKNQSKTSNYYQQRYINVLDNDMLIAQITSIIRGDKFSFQIRNSDLEIPLPKESEIRCNKIATIRKQLIIGKLSSLKPSKQRDLYKKICSVFD